MGIDPGPFSHNLFLYFFRNYKHTAIVSFGSTRAYKYHILSSWAINADKEVSPTYSKIYPKQLKLKIERQEHHTALSDFDIKIEKRIFLNIWIKEIDFHRDIFNLSEKWWEKKKENKKYWRLQNSELIWIYITGHS